MITKENTQERTTEVPELETLLCDPSYNNDAINLLIQGHNKGKISIDDYLGKAPQLPNINDIESSIGNQLQETKDFSKKYFGTPDTKKLVSREGIVKKGLKDIKSKLFGGKQEEVVKGSPGLKSYGQTFFEEAKQELEGIEKRYQQVLRTVAAKETYLEKVQEYHVQHEGLINQLEARITQSTNYLETYEKASKEDGLTHGVQERIYRLQNQVENDIQKTEQVLAIIYERQLQFGTQVEYRQSQLSAIRDLVSEQGMLIEGFKITLNGLEFDLQTDGDLIKAQQDFNNIHRLHEKVCELNEKVHQFNQELYNKNIEQIKNTELPQAYQSTSIREMSKTAETMRETLLKHRERRKDEVNKRRYFGREV